MRKEADILDNLTEADLKPGDIIFTLDPFDEPGHAAIWAPTKGSVRPLAHAANQGNNKKIMKSGILPDNYVVYRPKDEKLAQLAADIANRWCRYESPYDEQKREVGERIYKSRVRGHKGPEAKMKASHNAVRKAFEYGGKYRMIKYASRRMGPIHLPKGAGSGRGARCAMFVLMCYQTAAMAKHGLVEAISGGNKYPWVSDKYTNIKSLKNFSPNTPQSFSVTRLKQLAKGRRNWKRCIKDYSQHVERTRSDHEFEGYTHHADHQKFDEGHQMYPPSIVAWDFEANGDLSTFDFEEVLSLGLMLEQKTVDPEIFMYSLSQDNDMWESPGVVHIEKKIFSQEDKFSNAKEKEAGILQAEKMNTQMVSYLKGEMHKIPTFDQDVKAEKEMLAQFKK